MDAITKELQREDEIKAEAHIAVHDALLAGQAHPERITDLWRAALTQPEGRDRITREILLGELVGAYYRA
jgi:hypothetical protein